MIKGGNDGIQLGISSVNINSGMKNTLNIIEQSKEDRRKTTFDDSADRPVEGSNGIRNPIRSWSEKRITINHNDCVLLCIIMYCLFHYIIIKI